MYQVFVENFHVGGGGGGYTVTNISVYNSEMEYLGLLYCIIDTFLNFKVMGSAILQKYTVFYYFC